MKARILFCLVLSLAIAASAAAQKTDDWKWRFAAKSGIADAVRNATHVFVTDYEGGVHALDKRTGKVVWKIEPAGGGSYSLLLKQNTLLLVGGDKNQIQAINGATRQPLWNLPLKSGEFYQIRLAGNALLDGEEYLKAYDPANGKLLWENKSCRHGCSFEVAENQVFQFGGGRIFAVNAARGAIDWTFKKRGEIQFAAVNAATVFFEYDDGNCKSVLSFDRKTGRVNWQIVVPDKDYFHYTLVENRLYLAYFNAPRLLALDAATGRVAWDYNAEETAENLRFDKATVHQNRVYSGGNDGFLYVFDEAGGKLSNRVRFAAALDKEDLESRIASPLIVGGFGYLLEKNNIHKINLTDGKTLWKFAAAGGIEALEHEAGTLYFKGLESSYNALDLSKIERLARRTRPLGTASPDENALSREIPRLSLGSVGGSVEKNKQSISKATIAGGKVYFTVTDQVAGRGFLYEFDSMNGAKKVVAQIEAVNLSAPAIHDGIAYFYDLPLNIYEKEASSSMFAVNLADGKTKWRQTTDGVFSGAPEIVADSVYAARRDRTAARYDLEGRFINKLPVSSSLLRDQFIFGDARRVFYNYDSKQLVAFDLEKNSAEWVFSEPREFVTALADAPDGAVLVASYDDGIYRLDRRTGKIVWKADLPGDSFVSLKTSGGKIFAVAQSYVAEKTWLQTINLADGKPLWDAFVGDGSETVVFFENNVCLDHARGFSCFAQNDGRETFWLDAKNEFVGATDGGIVLYFIGDETTKTRSALQAINIKTGREIWRTNF